MPTRDGKIRCVYDLTPAETTDFDSLVKELKTSRIGLIREILRPGVVQEALVKAWKEVEKNG